MTEEIKQNQCFCCTHDNTPIDVYYNYHMVSYKLPEYTKSCKYPIYSYWSNIFDNIEKHYIQALFFVYYNHECLKCCNRIISRCGKICSYTPKSIIYDLMHEVEKRFQKKKDITIIPQKNNDYIASCKSTVLKSVLTSRRSSNKRHYKSPLGSVSCTTPSDKKCFYCRWIVFAYESIHHFSGDYTICDGCQPVSMYEWNRKINDVVVSGFGLYDERCDDCVNRMRIMNGLPIPLDLINSLV